jgi:tight adherence protein B
MVTPGSAAGVVAAFLAASLGTVALYLLAEWIRLQRHRRDVLRQLHLINGDRGAPTPAAAEALIRATASPEALWVQSLAERFPRVMRLEDTLAQAGLPWTLQRLLGLAGAWAAAGAVVGLASSGGGSGLLAGSAVGALLPWLHVRRKRAQRLRAFEEQITEGIDLIARAIRAGHPLVAGLRMVAEEAPEPLAGEFRRVFEEQKFGLPFEESLNALMVRIPLVDVRILVTAILIQRDIGGNLAEILDNLSRMIRTRFTIRRQLRTFTAQGRMSGYVLGGLPLAIAGILFLVNREYVIVLAEEPVGQFMVGCALALQLMGFLWIRKIVDIKF